jgi:hypothetical protein
MNDTRVFPVETVCPSCNDDSDYANTWATLVQPKGSCCWVVEVQCYECKVQFRAGITANTPEEAVQAVCQSARESLPEGRTGARRKRRRAEAMSDIMGEKYQRWEILNLEERA